MASMALSIAALPIASSSLSFSRSCSPTAIPLASSYSSISLTSSVQPLIYCGRGDKKTAKGKRFNHSFGNENGTKVIRRGIGHILLPKKSTFSKELPLSSQQSTQHSPMASMALSIASSSLSCSCSCSPTAIPLASPSSSISLTSSIQPLIYCGRGDKKTAKGKRFNHSFGNARPRNNTNGRGPPKMPVPPASPRKDRFDDGEVVKIEIDESIFSN